MNKSGFQDAIASLGDFFLKLKLYPKDRAIASSSCNLTLLPVAESIVGGNGQLTSTPVSLKRTLLEADMTISECDVLM